MDQGSTLLESELRQALQRADSNARGSMGLGLPAIMPYMSHQLAIDTPGTMIVERLPITKVDIKVEVAAFIEQNFISRTGQDGTIISLSKEILVEELTGLFYALEERSSQIDDIKVRKPSHDRSRKSQSDQVTT